MLAANVHSFNHTKMLTLFFCDYCGYVPWGLYLTEVELRPGMEFHDIVWCYIIEKMVKENYAE